MKPEELIKQLEEKLSRIDSKPGVENVGTVLAIGDGVVTVSGLSRVGYGEEIEFETGARGLAMGLERDTVSVVLLSNESTTITEGMSAKTTGRVLGVNVSKDLLGRVIDPLGVALDGKELKVQKGTFYPLEKIAPGVIERQSVDTPLKTGIKPIDTLTPIGRGQRQLIIGDRGTGKTAIAIDAIINQKKKDLGLPQVICIYCPIGQKRGNIAQTVALLDESDALDYTIIVAASASDPAPMQFLAPYAATAIAEYFMDQGQDVLVVYDDLSKHAWAYRQVSLLLRRPAGREAYPGDIFYLHSRLLERSSRMSKAKGGGSITSFPIIETQAGDVSAYIPTNVISITDGQIFLETDLFNSGTRPAINVGVSVSRVGGAAQTKAMRQVAGPVRLELAQFRNLAAFAQFGTDLDEQTAKQIERGKRVSAIMNQRQYNPFSEVSEIISTYAATSGLIDDVPVERISEFEIKILEHMSVSQKKLLATISTGDKMDDKTLAALQKAITDFKKNFLK
jgi:F-type H+-transporting ATPase subunit alpha